MKVHRIVCATRLRPDRESGHHRLADRERHRLRPVGALWGEITIAGGPVQQTNFDSYRVLRGNEMPQIEVHLLESDAPPGGIGETAVPSVAPAVCNAIFAATGQRLRGLPISALRNVKA